MTRVLQMTQTHEKCMSAQAGLMSRVCICKIRQRKWICIAFNQLKEYVYVQLSLLCMPSIHILYSPLFYNILLQTKTLKTLMISDQTYLLQFQQGVGYKQDCPIKLSPHTALYPSTDVPIIITTTQNVLEYKSDDILLSWSQRKKTWPFCALTPTLPVLHCPQVWDTKAYC